MRLIDADAFLEYCKPYPHVYQVMRSVLKQLPIVDAVPVIRCYECKHFKTDLSDPDESPWCYDGIIDPSFHEYCSRAERKEK